MLSSRANLSGFLTTVCRGSRAYSSTAVRIAVGVTTRGTVILGMPTSSCMSSINATIRLISSCPNMMASIISASLTSRAPASTIMMASFVPATTKLMELRLASSMVGFTMYSPLTKPTLTPAIGPEKGIFEIERAAEAPTMAAISGGLFWSTDKTVATT